MIDAYYSCIYDDIKKAYPASREEDGVSEGWNCRPGALFFYEEKKSKLCYIVNAFFLICLQRLHLHHHKIAR